ncbi:hypothetical protein D3C71_1798200 [compost metagenome]
MISASPSRVAKVPPRVSIDTPICAAFARSMSTTTSGLSKARSISRKANLPDS